MIYFKIAIPIYLILVMTGYWINYKGKELGFWFWFKTFVSELYCSPFGIIFTILMLVTYSKDLTELKNIQENIKNQKGGIKLHNFLCYAISTLIWLIIIF